MGQRAKDNHIIDIHGVVDPLPTGAFGQSYHHLFNWIFQRRIDEDRQQEVREGQDRVDGPHKQGIDPAAQIGCGGADENAAAHLQDRYEDPYEKSCPGARDYAGQEISS